jgi:hypothetical protein
MGYLKLTNGEKVIEMTGEDIHIPMGNWTVIDVRGDFTQIQISEIITKAEIDSIGLWNQRTSEMKANTTGTGPRRNFNSKSHWEESSKSAFLSELNELYKSHGAEVSIDIDGSASASLEVTLEEYITVGDDDHYFFQCFELPKYAEN